MVMRKCLTAFYSVIKGADADLHFVLLSGVSKFSQASLFSGLNNLLDITISPEYSDVCGYTDADLDHTFAAELAGLDRSEIRRWYDGYNWRGQAVYNPFDLLMLFQTRAFKPYWFESSAPSFLIKLLNEREVGLPDLDQLEVSGTELSVFEVEAISTETLMFQTGYLTMGSERRMAGQYLYKLRLPNEAVRQSLFGCLREVRSGNGSAQTQNTVY